MNRIRILAIVADILDGLRDGLAALIPQRVLRYFSLVPVEIRLGPGGTWPEIARGLGPIKLILDQQDVYWVALPLPRGINIDPWSVAEMQSHRISPIRRDLLVWDVVAAQKNKSPLSVVFMIRRDLIEAIPKAGLDIVEITADMPVAKPNFLRLHPPRLRRMALCLVALSSAFWVAFLAPPVLCAWCLDRQTRELEKQLAILAPEVRRVQQLRERVEFLGRDLDRTGTLLAQPSRRAMLDEVARLLPDNSWLQELSIDPEKLTLTGQSRDATPLLADFRSVPLFAEVRFSGPITRNGASSAEDFTLVLSFARKSRETP